MIRLSDDARFASKPQPQPAFRFEEGAEWGGPSALGIDAAVRALALDRGWEVVDADAAEHRFAAWTREEDARFDESAGTLAPTEARGFAARTGEDFFERAKAFKASLLPAVRPAFDARLGGYERTLFAKAVAEEDRAQLRAVRTQLDDSLQATAIPAAAAAGALVPDDPDKLARFLAAGADIERLIDGNPALPAYEKKQRKAAATREYHTAFAEALSPEEKQDLDPTASIETVGARIRRLADERRAAASDAATAEGSEAANPDGFGREAWIELIRTHRPELAEGKSIAEVLALRADPELSAEMRERGLADSARFLAARGHAATSGRLYLAHVASPMTALLLLEADPEQPAADVDPVGAPLRPDLFFVDSDETKPRTAGAVLALADARMDGTRLVDWRARLAGVSPEMQAALAADGREAVVRAAAEARAAEEEADRRWVENAIQGIRAGTFHRADLVKAGENLPGRDFDWLLSFIEQRDNDAKAIASYDDPTYVFDTESSVDQRAVDLVYVQRFSGDPQSFLAGDVEEIDAVARLIVRTGMLPTEVQRVLTKALTSDDEVEQLRGLTAIQSAFAAVSQNKPNQRIPPLEQTANDILGAFKDAFAADRGGGRSIADGFNDYFKSADGVIRMALALVGDSAVDVYDDVTSWSASGVEWIRETAYRYIEDWYSDQPQVVIDNRKAGVDSFIFGATNLPGFRGRRRRAGPSPERGLEAESFQSSGYSKSVDGRLLPVESRIIDGIEHRVYRVRTTETRTSDAVKGTPEHRALNNPEPNSIYILDNGKRFKTNNFGYVSELEFIPVRVKRGRGLLQTLVGKEGRRSDVGGHGQGARVGGTTDRVNLFPQDRNFNNGRYKRWENEVYRSIDGAGPITIKFLRDDPSNVRPDRLEIEYEINGRKASLHLRNEPGG